MANTRENTVKDCHFRAALQWYEAMGVTTPIRETSLNWLEPGQQLDHSWVQKKAQQHNKPSKTQRFNTQSTEQNIQSQSPINQPTTAQPKAPITQTPQTIAPLILPSIERAKELAKNSNSLEDLKTILMEFDGCTLKRTAKNLVFYRGSEQADLMIIGEAPGRDEDIVGKPFVGRAGQLLDRMLNAINLDSNKTHITNIVYWRPPGNRTPTAEEAGICRPFLDRQIELVAPKVILFLGGAAAKQMYETPTGITKLRGKWKTLPGDLHKMQTIATLHPAYLLRTPIAKRLAWQDLQMIKEKLESFNGR